MSKIKVMSENLANKISAGEVVERVSSVVKELVENSIDASSSEIIVSLINSGLNSIIVQDNGVGMDENDALLAFSRHATSKLLKEDDLFFINTLGFRGEALPSIASVSEVDLTTSQGNVGTHIKIKGGELLLNEKTQSLKGTKIEVKNLFFNTPARLKFLKSDKTEFSYIQEVVVQAALSRPDIAFSLSHNGSNILKTNSDGDLLLRIKEISGENVSDNLEAVEKTDRENNIKITGFVSNPQFTRSTKKDIRIFVNSRPIKCPVVLKAIDMGFKNLLPIGKFPYAVLNFEISPSEVDVNAHPTKKEIRWQNPNLIFNFTTSAIDKALTSVNYSKKIVYENNSSPLPFYNTNKCSEDKDDSYFVQNYNKYENKPPIQINYADKFRQVSSSVSSNFENKKLMEITR
mgnify:CR=1 FL=1